MLKKHQKGFAATEAILILVIVAIIAFVVWYVFHTSSDTKNTLTNAGNTQTVVPKQNNNSNTSASESTAPANVVTTKTDSKGAKYLGDNNGQPLYTYASDTKGVSNCTGACLADWPIYQATATTNLPDNVTVIKRTDARSQYAYKGLPLYYYTGDTQIGVVSGDGINGFHVAKP